MCLTECRLNPASFVLCPASLFTGVVAIDWPQVQEVYRVAYEQAQAVHRPPVTERLAPVSWN
jgi:hypothetical protein